MTIGPDLRRTVSGEHINSGFVYAVTIIINKEATRKRINLSSGGGGNLFAFDELVKHSEEGKASFGLSRCVTSVVFLVTSYLKVNKEHHDELTIVVC